MSVCRPGALVDFARHKQSDPLPLPLRAPASQTTPIPSAGVGQSENQGLGSTVFMHPLIPAWPGGHCAIRPGGVSPPQSSLARICVANLCARSEGALSFMLVSRRVKGHKGRSDEGALPAVIPERSIN